MSLQFRRGTDLERLSVTFDEGEPIYTTDTELLYIGDGVTAGGVVLTGTLDALRDVNVAGFLQKTVSTITVVSELATVTTATEHEMVVGQSFRIVINGYPAATGTFTVDSVVDGFIFTFTALGSVDFTDSELGNYVQPFGANVADGAFLVWDLAAGYWRAGTFADLPDINITSPTNNQVLLYNSTTGDFENTDHTLEQLTDVTVTSPSVGDVPTWTGSGWENVASGFVAGLGDLTDVDLTTTTPTAGTGIIYDGANWVPGFPAASNTNFGDLADVNFAGLSTGQIAIRKAGLWVNEDHVLSELTDVVLTAPLFSGAALVYDEDTQKWVNGDPTGGGEASVRGDGGNFTDGTVEASFAYGVYGGGDYATGATDEPWEDLAVDNGADGGLFTA